MEVRHFWRNRNRIAEIRVPAWPIPIQKTKLVMSQPQPTGDVVAPHADAGRHQVVEHGEQQTRSQGRVIAMVSTTALAACCSTMTLIFSVRSG